MKISVFKIHLEKFESYLLSFEKEHKTNFFLVKFRLEFKNKILSIDNVFKLREEILIMIII